MTAELKLARSKALFAALALCLHGTGLYAQAHRLLLSTSNLEFSSDKDVEVPSQTVLVYATTVAPLTYKATVDFMSPESGWLSAVASGDTAPSKVVVNVDASNLAPGFYMGYVKLVSEQAVSSVTVTFKVGPKGRIPTLRRAAVTTAVPAVNSVSVDPTELTFQTPWRSISATKALSVTGSVTTEKVYLQPSAGTGGWLRFNDLDYTVPFTINLAADTTQLSTQPTEPLGSIIRIRGTLSGTVYATLNATLTVTNGVAGGLTATPSYLQFTQVAGGTTPANLTIGLSASTATNFTVSSSANWLTVTPTSGTTTGTSATPTALTVSANGASLTPNPGVPYTGTITITAGQQTINIPVDLTVTSGSATTLTASPASLSFTQTIGSPAPDSKTVTLTSSVATTFTATTTASWLTLSLSTTAGATNTLTVSANAAGLSAGTIQATIQVTAGTSTISIPVTFSINTVAPSITATPTAISLTQVLGGPAPGDKIVVDSKNATVFTATSNAPWLTVTPGATISTPHELSVFVTKTLLAVGTYQAAVTIDGGTSPVTVPVTLTISGAAVTATPSALSFSQVPNAAAPPTQSFRIESNATGNFSVTSNANWLNVTPSSGVTPGTVTVSINAATLPVASYQSSVTVSTATITFDVPVTLSVANPVLTVKLLPAILEPFTAAAGASGTSAPQPKTVSVTSSGAPFTFTAAASTVDRGNWLSVSPASGTTPAVLTIAVNINGMPQGLYTGAITITPADTTIATSVINVSLNVTSNNPATSGITVKSVLNAASLQPGPLSPGEIVSIFGTGLGTTAGAGPTISQAGAVGTSIGDTRVLFEGVPAPLLYARADQINAIVPYGIYGRFASSLQIEVAGNRSDTLQLRVDPAAPGVFTANGTGTGQGAIVNQDGTINSPIYPAPRGSVIAIYGTGEGQTRPAGQDGRIITTDIRPPIGVVGVKIAGASVDVVYAGSAPGMVSGAFQINAVIPANTPTGGQIPLEVSIGGIVSQLGVMVAIK